MQIIKIYIFIITIFLYNTSINALDNYTNNSKNIYSYFGVGVGWSQYRYDSILSELTAQGNNSLNIQIGNKKLNNDNSIWSWNYLFGVYLYNNIYVNLAVELGGLMPGEQNVSGVLQLTDGTPANTTDFNFIIKRRAENYLALRLIPRLEIYKLDLDFDCYILAGIANTFFKAKVYPQETGGTYYKIGEKNSDGVGAYGWLLGLGGSSNLDQNWSVRFDYIYTKYSKQFLNLLNGLSYDGAGTSLHSNLYSKGNHHFNLNIINNFYIN